MNVEMTGTQDVVGRKHRATERSESTAVGTRVDSDVARDIGVERMMSRAAPQRWVARLTGKRGTKCWSPPRGGAGYQSGAARHDVLRLQACAKTGCVCRWRCHHAARKMSRRKETPRPNAIEETASQESQGQGRNNGRVEQATRLATIASNRAIIAARLVTRECANQGRLSFLHTWNLKTQLVQATHQTHEAIMDGTITTPQATAVELTQTNCMNWRNGGHGASFIWEPLPDRFPTETEDHGPHNEDLCSTNCRTSLDSLAEQVPDSRGVGSGAALEGESVVDTSDHYVVWSRSPLSNCQVAEKSNLTHDMCRVGEQGVRE